MMTPSRKNQWASPLHDESGPEGVFYFGVIMKKILLVIFLLPSLSLAEFSHESEVSILSSGGNSELSTWNLKSRNDYKLEKSIFQLSGHYTYGECR